MRNTIHVYVFTLIIFLLIGCSGTGGTLTVLMKEERFDQAKEYLEKVPFSKLTAREIKLKEQLKNIENEKKDALIKEIYEYMQEYTKIRPVPELNWPFLKFFLSHDDSETSQNLIKYFEQSLDVHIPNYLELCSENILQDYPVSFSFPLPKEFARVLSENLLNCDQGQFESLYKVYGSMTGGADFIGTLWLAKILPPKWTLPILASSYESLNAKAPFSIETFFLNEGEIIAKKISEEPMKNLLAFHKVFAQSLLYEQNSHLTHSYVKKYLSRFDAPYSIGQYIQAYNDVIKNDMNMTFSEVSKVAMLTFNEVSDQFKLSDDPKLNYEKRLISIEHISFIDELVNNYKTVIVALPAKYTITRKNTKTSRHLSTYVRTMREVPNPAYAELLKRKNQLRTELRNAESALRAAQNNASSGPSLGATVGNQAIDHFVPKGFLGDLVKSGLKSTVNSADTRSRTGPVHEAQREVDNIQAESETVETALLQTPMKLEEPVYAKYRYKLAKYSLIKEMELHYYIIENGNVFYASTIYSDVQNYSIPLKIQDSDPQKETILSQNNTLEQIYDYEEKPVTNDLQALLSAMKTKQTITMNEMKQRLEKVDFKDKIFVGSLPEDDGVIYGGEG